MDIVTLGGSGIKVSCLGFGTMTLGGRVDAAHSDRLLDICHDRGIDFFDTANAYNNGQSEEILGNWMRNRGVRDRLTVSTKVRNPVGDDQRSTGLSANVIHQQVDASLRRLDTDYIDILFFHQPDYDTTIDISLRAADSLISQGKVRVLGLSNYAAWQVVDLIHTATRAGWSRPCIIQPMYNAIARSIDTELVPMMKHYNLGSCAYNPLAGGLLTGKYDLNEDATGDSRLATSRQYRDRYWHRQQREAAASMHQLAQQHNRTPVELAMRFALDSNRVDSVLIGATSEAQLVANLDAADKTKLTSTELHACDEIWNELRGPLPNYNR